MWTNDAFRNLMSQLIPLLEASLDPVAVLDQQGEIVYMDLAMKSALGLRGRELRKRLVFWEQLKLGVDGHESGRLKDVLKKGESFRADDLPAQRKGENLRVSLKAVPVHAHYPANPGDVPVGAIVTLRDTTAEIMLQGKYHKARELLRDATAELAELRPRVERLENTLRSLRNRAA